MRLTARGRDAALLTIALWAAALVFASYAAAVAATTLTLGFAWAFASLPRPQLVVKRALARERFREGEIVVEELEIALRHGRAVQVHGHEDATPGLRGNGAEVLDARLSSGTPVRVRIEWAASTWGPKRLGPLRLTVKDGLRLLETDLVDEASLTLKVLPRAEKMGKAVARTASPEPALGSHNVTRPGDSAEFFALREYQSGDSIRRINWKASARSGDMIVNQVTRDTFSRIIVLLDLRAKEALGDDEASPRTLNGRAAASVLAHHERLKDHLNLIVVSEDAKRVSLATNPRAEELLSDLAGREPTGDMPMDEAVRVHLRLFRPRAKVFALTSAALDDRLADAIRLARGMGCEVTLIVPAIPADADPIVARSRALAEADVRSLGVRFVQWTPGMPLEVALHQS